MNYSAEVGKMCTVKRDRIMAPAQSRKRGKWVKSYEIKDISGLSHGVGWCAPQQGACKLTLNVKGRNCTGGACRNTRLLRHDAFRLMAAEILPGKTAS